MEDLNKKVSEIVSYTLKGFLAFILGGDVQPFIEESNGKRNGHYERDLGTRYGRIDDLKVPVVGVMNSKQHCSDHIGGAPSSKEK